MKANETVTTVGPSVTKKTSMHCHRYTNLGSTVPSVVERNIHHGAIKLKHTLSITDTNLNQVIVPTKSDTCSYAKH